MKEAPLYKKYLKGEYKPYDQKTLIETIKAIKKIMVKYVRIERIIRDIPSTMIVEGGAKVSNLEQLIDAEMKKEKWQCQCIRCREIKGEEAEGKPCLFIDEYDASKGKELFISFEDKKKKMPLFPFENEGPLGKHYSLPKRRNDYKRSPCLRTGVALSKKNSQTQHKGLGTKMIKKAEGISKKLGYKKIAIISGVGVKKYYKNKLGYKAQGRICGKDHLIGVYILNSPSSYMTFFVSSFKKAVTFLLAVDIISE